MKHTKNLPLLICICFLFPQSVCAAVIIDSVISRPSSCANNGSFTVFAQTNAPPLLYSITDGPSVAPAQSNNTFNSLAPGVYQLLVTNFNNDTTTRFVSISGSYSYPDFSPIVNNTTCSSNANGRIKGNLDPNTGNAPYTWQLTDLSTSVTVTQSSDLFLNLHAGNYKLTLTDSCLNTATHTLQVLNENTGIDMPYSPTYRITGCYQTEVMFPVQSSGAGPLLTPLTIRIATKNGVYTKPAGLSGNLITELIDNVSYGDTINTIVYNSCGDSFMYQHQISPFIFYPNLNTQFSTCNQQTTIAGFNLYYNTTIAIPVHYTLKDSATGNTVESGDRTNIQGITFGAQTAGRTYLFSISDSCGNTFSEYFHWPSPTIAPPAINVYFTVLHCLDSTASVNISFSNFPHTPQLVLLSGPAAIGSSKPRYAYIDINQYNIAILPNLPSGFSIHNLGAGVYHFRIWDDCGNSITDSFTITPAMVADDNYQLSYLKGCAGENKIVCRFYMPVDTTNIKLTTGTYTIKNLATGNVVQPNGYFFNISLNSGEFSDTTSFIPAGRYEVTINYSSNWGSNSGYHPNQNYNCWTIIDTIIIPPYYRPRITSATKVICHGNTFISLDVDSTTGVPPYIYEIVSGPVVFAPQSNPLFNLPQTGTYLARITDTCGTSSSLNFSVDTVVFPPINKFGSSCIGRTTLLTYQHSSYFTYHWQKPDGNIYTGDTLVLNPTTAGDLGLYHITRVVTINGCVDSASAYYNMQQSTENHIYDTICVGASITIGSHTYYTSGIYLDTFSTPSCDSIVHLHLYSDYMRDTTFATFCEGRSVTVNGHLYQQAGIFNDTAISNGCAHIKTAIITQNNYLRGAIIKTICSGEGYTFSNSLKTQTGIYRDTIPTNTCDSITVLYLTVLESRHETVSATICQGESYRSGNSVYTSSGSYHDTVPDTPCSKIIDLTLTVLPLPQGDTSLQTFEIEYNDSITLSACANGSAYLWNAGVCNTCPQITIQPTDEYNYYKCHITNTWGCSVNCNYQVYIKGIWGNVFIPNAFTPNGDGNNDLFSVYGKNIRVFSVQVFNRWGEKVFETESVESAWDGTYKDSLAPAGVYVYILKYSTLYQPHGSTLKGSVTLIR